MTVQAYRSIGEVVELLEPEFPGVSISKLRFLESKGLIEPHRAPSGYRRYSETDIAQLRWVLAQQRDHFLPLDVIADRLRRGELDIPADERRPTGRPRIDALRPAAGAVQLSAAEVSRRAGLSPEHLAALEKIGLVAPTSRDGRSSYGADDLAVAEIAAAFARHGIEPRHMRPYQLAADREGALIQQRIGALDGDEARRTVGELVRLGEDLRALLLRRVLARGGQR